MPLTVCIDNELVEVEVNTVDVDTVLVQNLRDGRFYLLARQDVSLDD